MDSLDQPKQVNSVCLTLLLQELVPMSIRVSKKLQEKRDQQDIETRINHKLSSITLDYPGTINIYDDELLYLNDVGLRLKFIGYNLGNKLLQILLYKSNLVLQFLNILDIMKFICRDVWKLMFLKQMDNLRTNHRGTFVLIDNNHKLIARNNSAKGIHDTLSKSKVFLWFSCGVIEGCLSVFEVDSIVTSEINTFPLVSFSIVTNINN
jgi:hypothetical protein